MPKLKEEIATTAADALAGGKTAVAWYRSLPLWAAALVAAGAGWAVGRLHWPF